MAINVFLLTTQHASDALSLPSTFAKHALWRGANFAFSQRAADFYEFLNNKIPVEIPVLIASPGHGPLAFTRQEFVQFFLSPREIFNCSGDYVACANGFTDKETAIIITDLEAFNGNVEIQKNLFRFDNNWGLYLPESRGTPAEQPDFQSFIEIVGKLLPPILFLVFLALPGFYLSLRLMPDLIILFHLALGFGLGIGWLTLGLLLLGSFGFAVSEVNIGLVMAAYWFAALVTHIVRWRKKALILKASVLPRPEDAILLLPALLSAYLSIGLSYSHIDEIGLWGAKASGILSHGLSNGVTNWGTLGAWYPLNIPLAISAFASIFGEQLPASKLMFPVFYLGLVISLYAFISLYVKRGVSLLMTLTLATTPIIFQHSTLAYANLPFTFYLVSGLLFFSFPFPNLKVKGGMAGFRLFGMLMLLLSAWTRPEGLVIIWAFVALTLFLHRMTLQRDGYSLAIIGSLLLGYTFFWYAISNIIYTLQASTQGVFGIAFQQILHGNFHFAEGFFILSSFFAQLFQLSLWGTSLWTFLLIIVLLALTTKSRGLENTWLFFYGILYILLIIGMYYAFSFANIGGHDISWWVATGLSRMLIPGVALILVGAYTRIGARLFPAGV